MRTSEAVIDAGELRHVVTIQQNTPTRNAAGEAIASWSTYATTRAAVEPLAGQELIQAERINANASTLVTIRYRAGITPLMRISHLGRTLEIVSVVDRGDLHIALDLACVEVKS